MCIFENYARYYNLLYRDKDYQGEANYIDRLIKYYNPRAQSVLDLGCGTGRHAFLLAKMGYTVTGVDKSKQMLNMAQNELSVRENSEPTIAHKPDFREADVRNVRLQCFFDVVVSLFHVISYQSTNADLNQVFQTVKTHLQPGGIFIFDFWYTPAVLCERPSVRIKRLEDKKICLTRIAEPVMHVRENIVDVNYQVFIKSKETGTVEELRERHRMRYLSEPEIELFLSCQNLDIIEASEFMTRKSLDLHTWNACVVARCAQT